MMTWRMGWTGGVAAALILAAGCSAPGPKDASRTPAADLYVAADGNDAWSGRIAAPDAARTDGPLATLAAARDRVRQLRAGGGAATALTVMVRGGTYPLDRAVEFAAQDSGSANAPVTYLAEPGATVRLTGGREVAGWHPVVDPAVLARLPEEWRGRIVASDLRAQGVTNWGRLGVRGFGIGSPPAEAELFYDDAPMTLARWPNEGFRGVTDAKDPLAVVVDDGARLAQWAGETDPWVLAYWHHDWAEMYEPLAGVDPARKALLRKPEIKPVYGITPKRARWYAFNLLAEIDRPGEYHLDRQSGVLYFLPPHPDGRAVVSVAETILQAENLSHVTFQGFVIEACRGTAVSIKGGTNCTVAGCTIRNTGGRGVHVSGGARHTVFGCDIAHAGEGGIGMSGGDRKTLTAAGHNAENNHVHHFGRRARTYRPGIAVDGVGNRIAHNLVHDGPHMALSAGGNDHIVEYNEIHNAVEESGDAGAYYVGRDWTARGNVLRYNYWHQIVGETGFGGMTIYLDDQHCGHTIHGNIFERCMQSLFIGGGDDNVVSNNVFLDCWKSAHLDNRGMGWQKAATDDPKGELRTRFAAMPVASDLWRSRYPTLAGTLEDEPNIPKRNVFARNISAGGLWDDITKSIRSYQTVTNNLVFDDDKDWAKLVRDTNGRPSRLEFKDPAAVAAIGFTDIPVAKIGLYADPRRASWPVRHEARPVSLPSKKKP